MTIDSREVLLSIIEVILETLEEAGEAGMPSGHMYMALSQIISLNSYYMIIGHLEKAGKITNSGHLLKIVQREGEQS